MLEKNDKEYKNSYEIVQQIVSKDKNTFIGRECDAMVLKSIKSKEEYLEKEILTIKNYLLEL